MAQAPKAPTRNHLKSSTRRRITVASLRGMVAKLETLRADFIAANDRFGKIECRFYAARPKTPKNEIPEMPPAVRAAFDQLTVGQLAVLPEGHPYKVWSDKKNAKNAAERKANAKTEAALRAKFGVDAAEAESVRTGNRMDRQAMAILSTEVEGVEALALKLRALRLSHFEFETGIFTGLLATIDATARAAGFRTTA